MRNLGIAGFWFPCGVKIKMRSGVESSKPMCCFDRYYTVKWSSDVLKVSAYAALELDTRNALLLLMLAD